MKGLIWTWGPVILLASIMFFLSSMSLHMDRDPFPLSDKVAHLTIYGIFAAFLFRALYYTWPHMEFWKLGILTIFFTILYGMSDEFHQSFVPMRTPDVKDLMADGFGAIVAVAFIFIAIRNGRNNKE